MNKNIKGIVVSSLALALIAGIVTAALAGTNALTEDTIAARDEATATAAVFRCWRRIPLKSSL